MQGTGIIGDFATIAAGLCTSGAVVMLSLTVIDIVERAVGAYQERYVKSSAVDLAAMFLFIDPRQLFLLQLAVMAFALLIGLLFFGYVITAGLAIGGYFFPILLVRVYRKRRIKEFERQQMDALVKVANAMKAGLTLPQAMENIARDAEPPLSQEYLLTLRETRLGVPLEDALVNMSNRVASDDLDLVVTSTNIARALGGNMAEMYDTISQTIRERFRLEGKIDSMTAQGRMQGWVVGLMPLALWMAMDWLRPDLMEPMMEHWFGYALIGAIAVLEALGMFFIRKITNVAV